MRAVGLRHSLITRLLVMFVMVAMTAVAATAWLATRTVTRAVQQEQGRSLAAEKDLYDTLVGYAATHRSWSGVTPVLRTQARSLKRRITLTTSEREVIADSGPGLPPAHTQSAATIDPLRLDLGLTGGNDSIDARAVGPYELGDADQRQVRRVAELASVCLRKMGATAEFTRSPRGRLVAATGTADENPAALRCLIQYGSWASRSEEKALTKLVGLTARCLDRPAAGLRAQADWNARTPKITIIDRSAEPAGRKDISTCLRQARREQLQPYTAPQALLFITDPQAGTTVASFTLSRANVARIVGVTLSVLLVSVLVAVTLGRRLTRPLRMLTQAADRQVPVALAAGGEIGRLAESFNDAIRRRDAAEQQRRDMVGDVAHELRNPLTNIRGWIEAAQDGLTPTDAALLGLLHEETLVLHHVIADLADLSAADAGQLRIHPEPIDLGECLEQVVDAHAGTAEKGGLTLTTQVRGGATLLADPVRLRQIVGNLVSNALRHTPSGGHVRVTGTVDAAGVMISVQDSGTGIAEQDLPRIFDRFWRADASRARVSGGSGLGLPIARQLARAHGGDITVHSSVGEGTTFVVRLPQH